MPQGWGRGLGDFSPPGNKEKLGKPPGGDGGVEGVGGRVPDPPLEDVIKSSLGVPTEGYTHQLNFLYPREGDVESLVRGLLPSVPKVRTSFRVTAIRRRGASWAVSDGREEHTFDRLVS